VLALRENPDLLGARNERADGKKRVAIDHHFMGAENGERVGMAGGDEKLDVLVFCGRTSHVFVSVK